MSQSRFLVLSTIKDLMTRRGVIVADAVDALGIAQETLCNLRNNTWTSIRRETLEKLCAYFNCTVSDLLVVVGRDIWFPALCPPGRLVTIHFATRVCDTPRAGCEPGGTYQQEVVFESDHRASGIVNKYLYHSGAQATLEGHSAERSPENDRHLDALTKEIFAQDLHVLIGSPVASPLSEKVVSRLYGARPFTPSERARFPYAFVYPAATLSSFGSYEVGREFGIYSTQTGRLVARRDRVPLGGQAPGQVLEDCGLIIVARLRVPPRDRTFGEDCRIVIALLGNGGIGTHGAAVAAVRPEYAAQLFPETMDTVRAAVVRVPYERAPGGPHGGRRILEPEIVEITDLRDGAFENRLVTAPTAPTPAAPPPSSGEGPRVRRNSASLIDAVAAYVGSANGRSNGAFEIEA